MPIVFPTAWRIELNKAKTKLNIGQLHQALEMIGYAEALYDVATDNGAGGREIIKVVKDDAAFKIKFGTCNIQPMEKYLQAIATEPHVFFRLYLELDHFGSVHDDS